MREPFRIRQVIASIFALGFLGGAVAALIAYVIRDGFDVSAGFGMAVAVAMMWLFFRAMAGSPPHAGTLHTLVGSVLAVLAIVGPVLLMILGYAPILRGASDVFEDRGLLVLAAVLLLLTFAIATLGGRRLIKANGGDAAEGHDPRQPSRPPAAVRSLAPLGAVAGEETGFAGESGGAGTRCSPPSYSASRKWARPVL
ncbi:MAG TPA: hypothetical protein VGD53_14120 [Actinoallomurus sp.]